MFVGVGKILSNLCVVRDNKIEMEKFDWLAPYVSLKFHLYAKVVTRLASQSHTTHRQSTTLKPSSTSLTTSSRPLSTRCQKQRKISLLGQQVESVR